MADRDGAAVAVEGPRFAGNMAVGNEGVQMLGGCLSCWPSVSAQMARLGRVDSPKPIRHAIDPERVAIDYADGLRKGWKGRKREDSGQNGQFHRFWLARDWGNNAAVCGR